MKNGQKEKEIHKWLPVDKKMKMMMLTRSRREMKKICRKMKMRMTWMKVTKISKILLKMSKTKVTVTRTCARAS